MVRATVDYVIVNIDRRTGECAIASRKMALGYKRNRFVRDKRNNPGDIVNCNTLVIGPKRVIVECNGFDLTLTQRDITYAAIADLRNEFKPGETLKAKLKKVDYDASSIEVSVKEMNQNPFDGANARHPINTRRQGHSWRKLWRRTFLQAHGRYKYFMPV